MELRNYQPSDQAACLTIFDSNLAPGAFQPSERPAFEVFLAAPPSHYFVMEHDGRVIGCGGYEAEPGQPLARLTWGMVARDLHGQGLGRYLLMYRMKEVAKVAGVAFIQLSTSQAVAPFFAKFAFRVIGEDPSAGLVTMQMKPNVCP